MLLMRLLGNLIRFVREHILLRTMRRMPVHSSGRGVKMSRIPIPSLPPNAITPSCLISASLAGLHLLRLLQRKGRVLRGLSVQHNL
jgi:hypothetical protein